MGFNDLETIVDDDGKVVDAHVKMTKVNDVTERKILDKKGKVIKIIRTFMVELEIDHQLITPIVKKLRGVVKICNTTVTLIGAGLEQLIKAEEEREKQQLIDDAAAQNTNNGHE